MFIHYESSEMCTSANRSGTVIVRDRQLLDNRTNRILFANCLRIPVETHLDILIVCSFLYMKQTGLFTRSVLQR